MSSDARPLGDARPPERSCSFCGAPTATPLSLQWYAPPEATVPPGVPEHGGLDLCGSCATEVLELTETWEARDDPPVAAERPVAAWYRRDADACSFCTDPLGEGPVAGLERYRDRTGPDRSVADRDPPASANYALCADCRHVVGQFLADVREDCRDAKS